MPAHEIARALEELLATRVSREDSLNNESQPDRVERDPSGLAGPHALASRPQLATQIEAQLSSSYAVRAQAQLARDRAQLLRADAGRVRVRTGARRS